MERCLRYWAWFLVCGFCLTTPLAADDDAPPMEDLRIPLQHYEDGTIKTQLSAGTARLPVEGDVEASQVRLESYGPDGKLESVVLADRCEYNRRTGLVRSKSSVAMEGDGVTITGTGFEWQSAKQTLKIHHDVRIVIRHTQHAGSIFGRTGAARGSEEASE